MRGFIIGLFGFLLIGLCHAAWAQTYPTKPIRLQASPELVDTSG
jgi:hypothetical protein